MRSVISSFAIAGILVSTAAALDAQGLPAQRRQQALRPLVAQQARRAMVARREMVARRAMAAQIGMIQRRAAAQGRIVNRPAIRDRIVARRAVLRERIRNLTPEQRQQLQTSREALRTERNRVGEQLRTGTITREQARTQMQAWRREHAPNLGLRPRRGPGGEF